MEKKFGIRIKKRNSIAARLGLLLLGVLMIFGIAFAMASLAMNQRNMEDMEIRETETTLNGVISGIQGNMETYMDISRLVMLNDQAIKYLRAPKADLGITNDARLGIMNVLNACRNVDSVFIFRNDGSYMNTCRGEYVLDFPKMDKKEWRDAINNKRGSAVLSLNGNGAVFKKKGPAIITISRAVYDILSQKQTGIMLMNISLDMLDRVVSAQDNNNVCILDTEGNYLAGDKELIKYYRFDYISYSIVHRQVSTPKGNIMVSGCCLDNMPIVIICTADAQEYEFPTSSKIILLILLLAFLVSVVAASTFIYFSVTKPIVSLTAAMEKTKESGWLETIETKGLPENEIGTLAESYNSVIEHLNDVFDKLIDKEKVAQRAEMRVLHEQIKPHFLYNSLETISFLALDAGAEKVHSALETLGSFYRNFLSKGDRIISLRREITIIKDYLSLQKLRYGDVIVDEYDIDEKSLDFKIPKLLLQPLVENSIYHGVRLKGEEGIIRISSRIEDDGLHIKVYDTGVGMSNEMIEQMLNPDSSQELNPDEELNKSFGLRGTIERIRYYCDNKDAVSIRSEEGEFTEVEIVIPLDQKH